MVQKNLRIWLWGPLLAVLLGVGCPVFSQTAYYVYPGGKNSNPGTAEQPFRTLYKALDAARETDVDTIRLAVGEYLVSSPKMGGEGEFVIPAGVVVQGGFEVQADGVVMKIQQYGGEEEPARSVLKGDSTCRIARVAGILEHVTVTGGLASQDNGGGVYVESGGIVRNCIIHSNTATGLVPKVGDLLMKDGSFVAASKFQADRIDELEGVVFWINPLKNAPEGQQGRVVSLKRVKGHWVEKKSGNIISADRNNLKTLLASIQIHTMEDALLDTSGKQHTDFILSQVGSTYSFPIVQNCRDYQVGGNWYMPASGELMLMLGEWATVWESLNVVWDRLTPTERETYFGVSQTDTYLEWRQNGSVGWNISGIISSSSYMEFNVSPTPGHWILNSFFYGSKLQATASLIVQSASMARPIEYSTFAVRKF
jgi:hypothetical protein